MASPAYINPASLQPVQPCAQTCEPLTCTIGNPIVNRYVVVGCDDGPYYKFSIVVVPRPSPGPVLIDVLVPDEWTVVSYPYGNVTQDWTAVPIGDRELVFLRSLGPAPLTDPPIELDVHVRGLPLDAAHNSIWTWKVSVLTAATDGSARFDVYNATTKVDLLPPVVTPSRAPAANGKGWNDEPVTVSFPCADGPGESGVQPGSESAPVTFFGDGAGLSATGTCTDNVGNIGSATLGGINIDRLMPAIRWWATPASNGFGWNNGDVTVHYACEEANLDFLTPDEVLTEEGADLQHDGVCTDLAGNTGTTHVSGIKIDRTMPTLAATPAPEANGFGWNNGTVTVTFDCSDALSSVDLSSAPVVLDGEGAAQGASGTCTDKAGNSATASVADISIDLTPPLITGSRSPEATNGWSNRDVTVTFSCSDALAGVDASSEPTTLSDDGAELSVSGTCSDKAGNSATASVDGINIDKTLPMVVGSRSPAANDNGWNNGPVTVHFDCTEANLLSLTADVVLGDEGAGQSGAGECVDLAGNSATTTVDGVNIDLTLPGVTASRSPDVNANGWNNEAVTLTFACSDALSGVASVTGDLVVAAEGADQSRTGTCIDLADNEASATVDTIHIDLTPPIITGSRSPDANPNGWSSSAVTVSFACTDALSGTNTVIDPTELADETAGVSVEGECTDLAGNGATAAVADIRIDLTPPTATGSRSPDANAKGWNNVSVTVDFACTDAFSGVDVAPEDVLVSGEGADQSYDAVCSDLAGNFGSATVTNVSIDLTPPTITGSRSPAPNDNGWNNATVTVHFDCADSLSDVASLTSDVLVDNETDGRSVSGSCEDNAGNAATISVDDVRIDLTPPDMTLDSAFEGWSTEPVTVSWTCSDALSDVVAAAVEFPVTTEGADQPAAQTCVDLAGNTASNTTYVSIDATLPVITLSRSPVANAKGWANGTVTVSVACQDALSGVASSDDPSALASEGADQSATLGCDDVAGNHAEDTLGSIHIDLTRPSIEGTAEPAANEAGWNNAPVTVGFTCTDALSGVASVSDAIVLSNEGEGAGSEASQGGQSATGTCVDNADNTADATVNGIRIDLTAPTVAILEPAEGAVLDGEDVLRFNASDALSGLRLVEVSIDGGDFVEATSPFAFSLPDGTHTFVVRATDAADNVASTDARSVVIDSLAPTVDIFAPTEGSVVAASGVALGFEADGTGSAVTTECSIDGGSTFAPCASGDTLVYPEGSTGSLVVRATDATGRAATDSVHFELLGAVAEVLVTPSEALVPFPTSLQFTAQAFDAHGNEVHDATFEWTLDPPSVGAIDATGLFVPAQLGEATVLARHADGPQGSALVTVQSGAARADRLTLAPSPATIAAGGTLQFNATAYAGDAVIGGASPTFEVLDTDLAFIDGDGLLQAYVPGATVVVARYDGLEARANLTITAGALESLFIDPGAAVLGLGEEVDFNVTGMDAVGNEVPLGGTPAWSIASGPGTIDAATGLFQATDAGFTEVNVSVGGVYATAVVLTGGGDAEAGETTEIESFVAESEASDDVTTTAYTAGVASADAGAHLAITPPASDDGPLSRIEASVTEAARDLAVTVGATPGKLDVVPEAVDPADLRRTAASAGTNGTAGLFLTVRASIEGQPLNSTRLNEVLGPMRVNFRQPASYFTANGLSPSELQVVKYANGERVQASIQATLLTPTPVDGFYNFTVELPRFSTFALIWSAPAPARGGGGGGGGIPPMPLDTASTTQASAGTGATNTTTPVDVPVLELHSPPTIEPTSLGSSPLPGEPTSNSRPLIAFEVTVDGGIDAERSSVTLDGKPLQAMFVSGTVSVLPDAPLADGVHAVRVTLTDQQGRTVTKDWTITTDTQAPVLDASARTSAGGVAVTVVDAVSGVDAASAKATVDGKPAQASLVNGEVRVAGVGVGKHTVTLQLADKAGNVATRTYTVDIAEAAKPAATPLPALPLLGLALVAAALVARRKRA